MRKFNHIGLKLAGALFLFQALYSFVTELTQEAYLDKLVVALLFFILSQFYEPQKQSDKE